MGIRCILSIGIRCLLSKVRDFWEETLYPVGISLLDVIVGPIETWIYQQKWGSSKHMEGRPGQRKQLGQSQHGHIGWSVQGSTT